MKRNGIVLVLSALALSSCNFLPVISNSSASSQAKTSAQSSSLSESQSSEGSDSVVSSEGVTNLKFLIGGRISYEEESNEYTIHLLSDETIDFASLIPEGYSVNIYSPENDIFDMPSATSIHGKPVDGGYGSSSFKTSLSLKDSKGKTVEQTKITIGVYRQVKVAFEESPTITTEDNKSTLHIKRGIPGAYKAYVVGFPDLEMEASLSDRSNMVINEDGNIVTTDASLIGNKAFLSFTVTHNEEEIESYGGLFVEVVPTSDSVVLTIQESDLVKPVAPETTYHGSTQLNIPYSGNYYEVPEVAVEGYEGDYEIAYVSKSDYLAIEKHQGKTYLKVTPGLGKSAYLDFEVDLLNGDEVVTELAGAVHITETGNKVAAVQLGEDTFPYYDGDTVYVQQYLKHDIFASLNGIRNYQATISNITNPEVFKEKYSVLNADTAGTSKVTYTVKDKEENEYTITLNIVVEDKSILREIYVPSGADALTVVDDHVYIDGPVMVSTDKGFELTVNGREGLTTRVEDDTSGKKNVTFVYSNRGQEVSASYLVAPSESGSYPKKTLSINYGSFEGTTRTTPNSGDVKCLVIPIWFNNSSSYVSDLEDGNGVSQKEQIRQDLNTVIFGESDDLAYESVASFYYKESHGAFYLSGTVTPWYECGLNSYDLKVKDSIAQDEWNLTTRAINWYFENSEETLDDYDSDKDGVIDSVMVYYGTNGYGTSDLGVKDYYSRGFQYAGSIRNKDANPYSRITFFSAFDMYKINSASDPAIQLATPDLSTLCPGFDTVTAIHEYGHTFGVTDYYDEMSKVDDASCTPAGEFTMQNNNNGGHEPFSTMTIGWTDPTVFDASLISVGETINVTLHDFQSSNEVLLLTPSWSVENEAFDEYILLELYTPTGLNEYHAKKNSYLEADTIGIRVWHVDGLKESELTFVYSNFDGRSVEDILHLIRRDSEATFSATDYKLDKQVFKSGDSFDMETYKGQFFKADGKLNNGKDLGWEFEVNTVGSDAEGKAIATITLKRV